MTAPDKRLIEDYLPLDDLNAIASTEKLHPRRYVELIHYWPARRPITAVRAAIYASLVAAPKTNAEREIAKSFVTALAAYKPQAEFIKEACKQIRAQHGGRVPKVLDMFAGGGAIPLEASRLGCESHAIDYNPVAHLIELCTLVYPQTYGAKLADDFKHWSQIVLDRTKQEVNDLYPQVQIPETTDVTTQMDLFGGNFSQSSQDAEPVAYIWARTVPCRHPGCNAPVPLVRQAWLRKKKNGAVAAIPQISKDNRLHWDIVSGRSATEIAKQTEQTGAGQAVCIVCNTPVPSNYVKEMSKAGCLGESLAAIAINTSHSKLYLSANSSSLPDDNACARRLDKIFADTSLAPLHEKMNTEDATTVAGRGYGISLWSELFTPRQLVILFTFIKHIRRVHKEMLDADMDEDRARALITYFAMSFGRLVIIFNKFASWNPRDQITRGAIGDRQALKMVYDFSDINPFATTTGSLPFALDREMFCIRELAKIGSRSVVTRGNSEKLFYEDQTFDAVITDPPYYSSIYYADLSAFFYIWLKRIVGDLYPEHFALSAPPKRREAVAQPSQHDGDTEKAKAHYEEIMRHSFVEAGRVLKPGAPFICIYAHRTTEGWATLIRALVDAGMTVTEAWPVQTESRSRINAHGAAALSDSIFFVARRREGADIGQFETTVEPELYDIARERVKTLWSKGKGIGGADLLMAAVGAGLRAYTRFAAVQYANGSPVPAEHYLREVEGVVLDVILDEIFGLQDSAVASVDAVTRFYILWRFTYRESAIEGGDAYVFCYPQGIEIDGPEGLSGAIPKLIEKNGSKFRVRDYNERGSSETLGIGVKNKPASIIDVLHRLLWLLDNRPADLHDFLERSRPNREQLRLVVQALSAPVLSRSETLDVKPTEELNALSRLNANWQGIIEGAGYAQKVENQIMGQQELAFGGDN